MLSLTGVNKGGTMGVDGMSVGGDLFVSAVSQYGTKGGTSSRLEVEFWKAVGGSVQHLTAKEVITSSLRCCQPQRVVGCLSPLSRGFSCLVQGVWCSVDSERCLFA
jgi:hypothetical protein